MDFLPVKVALVVKLFEQSVEWQRCEVLTAKVRPALKGRIVLATLLEPTAFKLGNRRCGKEKEEKTKLLLDVS